MAMSLFKTFPNYLRPVARRSTQILSSFAFTTDSISNNEGENINSKTPTISPTEEALGKFGKLVETVQSQQNQSQQQVESSDHHELSESFARMLRKSRMIALGDDQDKRVTGQIIEVMEDDLYIDFGGKFHCVCPRPRKDGDLYQRGTQVIVNLKSQEMSSAFLGSDKHITLLEADAVLLGLRYRPKAKTEVKLKEL